MLFLNADLAFDREPRRQKFSNTGFFSRTKKKQDPEGLRIFDVFVVKYNSDQQSYLKVLDVCVGVW